MRPGPKGSAGTTCTEDLQPGIRQPRKPAARKQDPRCSGTVSVRIPAHKTVPKRPHSAPRERGYRGERLQFRACRTLHRTGLRGAFLTDVPAHRCTPESVAASPRSACPAASRSQAFPADTPLQQGIKKGRRLPSAALGSGSLPQGSYSFSSFLAAASMALFRAARPAMSPSVVFSTEALIFFTVDFVASAAARFSAFSAAAASRRASS